MKEIITLNDDNIDAYSRSWNQREQISSISIMMDQFLKRIEEFSMFIIPYLRNRWVSIKRSHEPRRENDNSRIKGAVIYIIWDTDRIENWTEC